MYKETKRIIREAMFNNKLVVFAGAGVSKQSGIPLWSEVTEQIKSRMNLENEISSDNLKIPQFYYNSRGFKEYNELMKQIFLYSDKSANDLHRKIFELKPAHIITTNYDDFFEKAANENGEFLEVIEKDTDIPYIKNKRSIIKMHGGFTHDNYVLKEDDYLNYSSNFKLIETLVKAIIAQNTVLFIGYSFEDPDTKQIFNWLKYSLGDNFQRAYMIIADKSYNKILDDYYANLGINLIFAENFINQDKEYIKKEIFSNTIKCLNYIIADEEILDLPQLLCSKLKPYEELNYIRLSHINSSINLTDSKIAGYLLLTSLNVRSEEALELWKKIIDGNDVYSIRVKELISKSSLEYILLERRTNGSGIDLKPTDFEFISEKYWNLMHEGDLCKLSNIIENINIYDTNANLNNKFEVAYYYYEVKNYKKAINILQEISKNCLQQKNYLWHFIAEFNIKHLRRQNFDRSSEMNNVQEIIYKYGLYSEEDNYLLEIANFSMFYYAFYRVSEMSKKSISDSNTKAVQDIDNLELYVVDLYNFISTNFLMIQKYSEIREIFKVYLEACLVSHFSPMKEKSDFFWGTIITYSMQELSQWWALFAIEFSDVKSLKVMFNEYRDKQIILNEEAINLLLKRAENYIESYKNNIYINYEIINRILYIATKSQLSYDTIKDILSKIIIVLTKGYYEYDFLKEFNIFIVHLADKYPEAIEESFIQALILEIVKINESIEENPRNDFFTLEKLFVNLCAVLKRKNINISNNKSIVERFVSGRQKIKFLCMYNCCSDQSKEILKSYAELHSKEDLNIYVEAQKYNVFEPNIESEDKIYNKATELHNNRSTTSIIIPDDYESILNDIVSLKIWGKLIDSDKFEIFFESGKDIFSFLNDVTTFNYNNFEIDWLLRINHMEKVMMELSSNPIIKKQIGQKYKERQSKVGLNKFELDTYFKYFD